MPLTYIKLKKSIQYLVTNVSLLISLQNVAGLKAGGTLSALINWVASGSTTWVSLLPRSTSDCVWYAYFVLQMEQEVQEEKTGLWRELLKELASSTGKANVDNALKVCGCAIIYFLRYK